MQTIHVLLGSKIKEYLPIIVKFHSINLLISLGKSNLDTPLFEIEQFLDFDKTKSNKDIRIIINKLKKLFHEYLLRNYSIDKYQIYICISGSSTKENLIMSYLSQALNCRSYYFEDKELIELYPHRLEHISPLEFKVLRIVYEKDKVDSLKELMDNIDFEESDIVKATAKMGYIINKLTKSNYVNRTKKGRSVKVSMTPQGRQYLLLFSKNINGSKL